MLSQLTALNCKKQVPLLDFPRLFHSGDVILLKRNRKVILYLNVAVLFNETTNCNGLCLFDEIMRLDNGNRNKPLS